MKKFKLILLGVIIGLALGLWFGTNMGKGKSIFSNPFETVSIQDRIKQKGNELMKGTKDAIRDSLKE